MDKKEGLPSKPYSGNRKRLQNGNPHKLTIKQHILPAASIRRFSGPDGLVNVEHLDTSKPDLKLEPENPRFATRRHWDQRSEDLSKKNWEDPFQAVADTISRSAPRLLTAQEASVVTQMYGLWKIRSWLADNPMEDVVLDGVKGPRRPEDGWTQDEGEQLEKTGFMVADLRDQVSLPGRMMSWPFIQKHVRRFAFENRTLSWGLIEGAVPIFKIPDRAPSVGILPITPSLVLVASSIGGFADESPSKKIMNAIRRSAKEYLISRP